MSSRQDPIRSRDGLTRCSACRAHIHASDRPSTTECPFCGATVSAGRPRISLPGGRGGLLAASLLALGACGGPSTPPAENAKHEDTGSTMTAGSNENENEDALVEEVPPEEQLPPPMPAYGMAPRDRYQTRPEQPPDEPMYGIAP